MFLLFLLQNSLNIVFPQNTPSFVLIGVIFYALTEGPLFGFVIGCFAGIFLEMFGVGRVGYEMLILGVVGAASGFIASKVFRDSLLTQLALPALSAYFMVYLNLVIVKAALHEPLGPGLLVEAFLFPNLFWTVVLSPLIFSLLKGLMFRRKKRLRW